MPTSERTRLGLRALKRGCAISARTRGERIRTQAARLQREPLVEHERLVAPPGLEARIEVVARRRTPNRAARRARRSSRSCCRPRRTAPAQARARDHRRARRDSAGTGSTGCARPPVEASAHRAHAGRCRRYARSNSSRNATASAFSTCKLAAVDAVRIDGRFERRDVGGIGHRQREREQRGVACAVSQQRSDDSREHRRQLERACPSGAHAPNAGSRRRTSAARHPID